MFKLFYYYYLLCLETFYVLFRYLELDCNRLIVKCFIIAYIELSTTLLWDPFLWPCLVQSLY
jgi:hypothetical protein